jgi:hypothetical protein
LNPRKKEAKNFYSLLKSPGAHGEVLQQRERNKSFLVLFFKKEQPSGPAILR